MCDVLSHGTFHIAQSVHAAEKRALQQEMAQLRQVMQEREHQLGTEQRAFELEKVAFLHRIGEQEKMGSEERQVCLCVHVIRCVFCEVRFL